MTGFHRWVAAQKPDQRNQMAATSARRILIVDDEGIIHERLRADELQRQSFAIRKNRKFIGKRASLVSRTAGGTP
tara:strand:- start:190 stop:414 length:225 start_codon:yes stop_codon:yes gene_type:complete